MLFAVSIDFPGDGKYVVQRLKQWKKDKAEDDLSS